jgi:hypothetical protein
MKREYLKEYSNGNQQAGELEEDQEKDGLKILKRRYPDVRNKRVEKAEYGKDGMEEDH